MENKDAEKDRQRGYVSVAEVANMLDEMRGLMKLYPRSPFFENIKSWEATLNAGTGDDTMGETHYIDIVFDGPPSHESGRFVEVENDKGEGISAGEWIDRGNGPWALRIPRPPPTAGIDPVDLKHSINALCGNHCTETGCKAKTKADCDKCAIGMHLKDLNVLVDEAPSGDEAMKKRLDKEYALGFRSGFKHGQCNPLPPTGIDPAEAEKVMDELGKVPLTSTNILDANKQKWATVDALAALIEAAKKQVPMVPAPDYPGNQSDGCAICGVPGRIGRAIYLCKRCADKPMMPVAVADRLIDHAWQAAVKLVARDLEGEALIENTAKMVKIIFSNNLAPYRAAPKGDEPKCKTCGDDHIILCDQADVCTNPEKCGHGKNCKNGILPCPDCAEATEPNIERDAPPELRSIFKHLNKAATPRHCAARSTPTIEQRAAQIIKQSAPFIRFMMTRHSQAYTSLHGNMQTLLNSLEQWLAEREDGEK